jgi:hypothetical protein
MSFFLDLLPVSFGFRRKAVSTAEGGGVTAGSMVSIPNDFFVKAVVAIDITVFEPFHD